MSPTDVSKRIREVREKRQLTQAELARLADLPPAAISHFETGIRIPGTTTLRRLADALGVSLDFLLGRDLDPQSAGLDAQAIFRNLSQLSERSRRALRAMSDELRKMDDKDAESES